MYVDIAGKLFFGFIALMVMARLLGKKELAQLTPFDFIYAIVLGGIVEESIYEDTASWRHVWFAVAVWGALHYVVGKATLKSDWLRVWLKGESSILVKDGKFNVAELNRNRLEMEQLRIMLRQQGVFSFREVKDLYLEPGGEISLQKYAAQDKVTPEMLNLKPQDKALNFLFIDEGEVNKGILSYLGKDLDWLKAELRSRGINEIEEVLYAEWAEDEGLYIQSYKKNEQGKSDIVKGN
ncbi:MULTISPECIES: DUF421 domain-containing protein [unclassified Planococcus (in: firmicutes)]|uniref:DUF421 domain-containing protein n=1 Tax=Planococcus TaxID=1372 RepID=UPI000C338C84|nr:MULTISPECIES: DUF421 domain-containing protein [unclassified Planococcus (in: firmicutes)]AUD14435.1 hypothetical protein CW734_13245 [Planococcus sp. MB-3u-03]PKG44710.1 hypothetical protein CXF66_15960 [Planococcus sp. Urea-trap-24]PKG87054.1 hypothetical protein CXF91_13630 [Planococcus sp. Urea-3u-39]PKH41108.1 hypothetical protein CXF77_06785 [Planococcus sp. MB-3u-09]